MNRFRAMAWVGVGAAISLWFLSGCEGDSSGGGREELVRPADITVDGDSSDWTDIKPLARDVSGDAPDGFDLAEFYVARNEGTLFLRIDMAGTSVSSDATFLIAFYPQPRGPEGQAWPYLNVRMDRGTCVAYMSNGSENQPVLGRGQVAVLGNVLEVSIPLTAIDISSYPYMGCAVESQRTLAIKDSIDGGNVLISF